MEVAISFYSVSGAKSTGHRRVNGGVVKLCEVHVIRCAPCVLFVLVFSVFLDRGSLLAFEGELLAK